MEKQLSDSVIQLSKTSRFIYELVKQRKSEWVRERERDILLFVFVLFHFELKIEYILHFFSTIATITTTTPTLYMSIS